MFNNIFAHPFVNTRLTRMHSADLDDMREALAPQDPHPAYRRRAATRPAHRVTQEHGAQPACPDHKRSA